MTTIDETILSTVGTNAPSEQTAPLTGKRANWTIAHKIEGQLVKFSVKGAGELVLDVAKVNAANRAKAEMHGFVQRISDAAAMARDGKTGASATPQQKFEAMKRLVEHYSSGSSEWSPARSTEGVGRPRVDTNRQLLMSALLVYSPQKGAETIAKFVAERSAAQVTALLLSAELKEAVAIAREELEKAQREQAQGVDVEGMLSGL